MPRWTAASLRATNDHEADAFYVRFTPESTPVAETREIAPGVMLDLDNEGQLVGIEVLYVSESD